MVLVAAMAIGFAVTGGILMHKQDMPALAGVPGAVAARLPGRRARSRSSPGIWPTCSSPSTAAPTWPGWSRGWIPEELALERHRRWWEAETGGDAAGADAAAADAGGDGAGPAGADARV